MIKITIQQAEEIAAQKGCTIFDLINEWARESEPKELKKINQMASAFITDYHIQNQVEFEHLTTCSGCNMDFEDKDVRYSKITGEYLCVTGISSCWKEAEQDHKQQCKEWGQDVTSFE